MAARASSVATSHRGDGFSRLFLFSLVISGGITVFNCGVRFLGYFFLVFVAMIVLRQVPIIGGVFRIPLFGFFLSAAVVSALVARGGLFLSERHRIGRDIREIGAVDTPHNRGRLGRLYLLNGRPRVAVGHLEAAVEGEPDEVEWQYRLGDALASSRQHTRAIQAFERAAELNEQHAYGQVLTKLANSHRASGDPDSALAVLDRFEVLHGPTPESACRRGLCLKALGRKDEASRALASVGALVAQAAKYQRAEAYRWGFKAALARLF